MVYPGRAVTIWGEKGVMFLNLSTPNLEGVLSYNIVQYFVEPKTPILYSTTNTVVLNACCPWNSTMLTALGLQDWWSGFSLPLPPYLLLPQLTSGWLAFYQVLKHTDR